jgi:hypothetical protein
MEQNRYNEDLLTMYKQNKVYVNQQIEQIEPLAAEIQKPVFQRVLSKGMLWFNEFLCYALIIGIVLLIVFKNQYFPAYLLQELQVKPEVTQVMGTKNMEVLNYVFIGLLSVVALLLFILARQINITRRKNAMLNKAAKSLKLLVGDLLKQRARIQIFEERYFEGLDTTPSTVSNTAQAHLPNAADSDDFLPEPQS